MKKGTLIFAVVAILVIVASCKKYPEGPWLSLRSKAERVANNWKIAEALNNSGSDITTDYNEYELDLSRSGSASLLAKYSFFGTDFNYSTSGTWVFVDDKDKISFDFENNAADGVYSIRRLEEKEMWLRKDDNSVEFHFVPR